MVASIGQGALLLVYYASEMAGGMILDGYGPATYQAGIDAMTATFGVGFMSALADAARAVLSVSALLRSKAGVRQLSGPTYSIQAVSLELDGVVATAASTVGRYTQSVAQALRLVILTSGITNDPPVTTSIPAVVLAGAEELASSQLLAAAAACLTDCPPPPANSTVPNSTFLRNHMFYNMRSACSFTVQAMWCMMRVQGTMTSQCGIEGQRLAAGLMRATRHEAVERLRMGLLDQLAAHAGMGAQLQQQQQGEEEHEQEGQQQGACWVGRSGAWWFANEEAGCGKLLGMDPKGGRGSREEGKRSRSRTAGWLEDYHCHIVYVTLVDWRYAVCDEPALAVAAGLPASPPPLLLARLVARAAEALCRLCRGQGLGGAYAPAPEWELAMSQVCNSRGSGRGAVLHQGTHQFAPWPAELGSKLLVEGTLVGSVRSTAGMLYKYVLSWYLHCPDTFIAVAGAGAAAPGRHGGAPGGHGPGLPAARAGGGGLGGGAHGGGHGGGHGAEALYRTTGLPAEPAAGVGKLVLVDVCLLDQGPAAPPIHCGLAVSNCTGAVGKAAA